MSNIQYGLISRVDSNCLEKTFDLIAKQFQNEVINYCEIGLYHGRTTSGVKRYMDSKGYQYNLTGIDNFKDKEELVFLPEGVNLIEGSSIEVYNQLEDNSQHFIFVDGNHSFPYVIADFFCYAPKVKVGGYMCFHDAAPHAQNKSWQRMGSKEDMDMFISVRKALKAIGLIDRKPSGLCIDMEELSKHNISIDEVIRIYDQQGILYSNTTLLATRTSFPNWELVFDEADLNDDGSGVLVFKKLY